MCSVGGATDPDHWHISDAYIGVLTSSIFAGMTLGSVVWGSFADLYGRRYVFLRTLAITALFGALLSMAPSFAVACILCFGVGTGVGGSMPTDGTLFLESIPKKRHYYLTALSVFFSLGSVVCAVIALLLLPGNSCTNDAPCKKGDENQGWRHVVLSLAGITALFAMLRIWPFDVQESPTFLVATHRLQEACDALQEISEANSDATGLSLPDVQRPEADEDPVAAGVDADADADEDSETHALMGTPFIPLLGSLPERLAKPLRDLARRSAPLVAPPHRRAVLLTWALWALMSLAFTMFNAFYPIYLQRKLGQHDADETQALRDYVWYALSSVPGSLLGALLTESPLGRAKSLALALLATVGAQVLFLLTEEPAYVVLSGMGVSLAATTAYAILYGYTPNVFPTSIRGTACAVASALGRITGIAAPLLAGALLEMRVTLPILTSIVLFSLCAVTALLLPSKTRLVQL